MTRATRPAASGSWFDTAACAVKAGLLPGTLVAALGDFFAPVGFWAAPFLAGVAALLLLVGLGIAPGLRRWVRSRFSWEQQDAFWREPFLSSAAFWVLAVFGSCGIVFGTVSYSRAAQGGFLAQTVPIAASLQKLAGIAEQSLQVQVQTGERVQDLLDIAETGVAEDPRVTLRNRGVDWTALAFSEALDNADMETVELFLAGGMPLRAVVGSEIALSRHFRNFSPEVARVLVEHSDDIPAAACLPHDVGGSGYLEDWITDEERLRLYADICDKPAVRKTIETRVLGERESRRQIEEANARIDIDRASCESRLERDFTIESALQLGFPPSIDGNSTIDAPEERVAVSVQLLLNDPALDDRGLRREYAGAIRSACEDSFVRRDVPTSDSVYSRIQAAF